MMSTDAIAAATSEFAPVVGSGPPESSTNGAGPKLIIRSTPLPRPARRAVARRLVEGARATVVHLVPLVVRMAWHRRVDDAAIASALRKVFDDLGGSFSKLGQLIGSSPSLFGDDVAAVFRTTR